MSTKTKKQKKAKVEKQAKVTQTTKAPAHKVGDIHPNGIWVWTEYKEGKFDWRVIPTDKKEKAAAKTKENKKEKKADKTPAKEASVTINDFPVGKYQKSEHSIGSELKDDSLTIKFGKVGHLTPVLESLKANKQLNSKFDFVQQKGEGRRVYEILVTVKK